MSDVIDVAIVGAGGFGREILQYALDARETGWPHRIVGFVDDRPDCCDGYELSVPILGPLGEIPNLDIGAFLIGVGAPAVRRKISKRLTELGRSLITLAHPSAYVAPTSSIGSGTILCPFSMVGSHAVVGSNVAVNVYASVGHDASVGRDCVLSPYSALTGGVVVGDEVFFGTHSTVAPQVSIGSYSKVSAGSFVRRGAPPGSLLVGNPAKGRVMLPIPDQSND